MGRYRNEPIKTMKIAGVKYEIHVNSDGVFSCHVGLDHLKADTLKALIPQMQKSAKRLTVSVRVPATLFNVNIYDDGSIYNRKFIKVSCVPITLIGIHGDTHEIKFRDHEGKLRKGERFRNDEREFIGKPMKPASVAEWERLKAAKRKAEDEFDEFEKRFKWDDVYSVVKDAIEAAADKPEDEDTEDPR